MENNKKVGKSVLGRGLSALISTPPVSLPVRSNTVADIVTSPGEVVNFPTSQVARDLPPPPLSKVSEAHRFVPVDSVKPNPAQPRQYFSDAEIKELSESVKSLGVLQPLLVRPLPGTGDGQSLELIAGERRWRAAKLAGISHVPVIIKEIDDRTALEVALVENVQREDLNPVEQALAYQRLIDEFSLSQQDVADRVGKDRASVSNIVRLLKLPKDVLEMIRAGELSTGHAKALLAIKEPAAQSSIARKAVKDGLSVRALEAIVSDAVVLDSGRRNFQKKGQLSADEQSVAYNAFPAVVDRMRNVLGTKVCIKHHKSGRGRVEIEYYSEQELDRLVEKICPVHPALEVS